MTSSFSSLEIFLTYGLAIAFTLGLILLIVGITLKLKNKDKKVKK